MASKWAIDPSHSAVHFTARHMVVAKVRGTFTKFSANLDLDETDLTKSKIEAHIDAASLETREEKRDEHLRSADFLDVQKYPELVFKSKKIAKTGDGFELTGDLTIKDKTHEVSLDVEYGGKMKDPWGNERAVFTAATTIDRKQWGLVWNVALETGGVLVGDKISIEIEIEAIKQK
jgi:polyisoprenoid-binding protein YceI